MKVGDYVRTDTRGIWQLDYIKTSPRVKYTHCIKKHVKNCTCYTRVEEKRIVKSSPNIIDLIEVGDVITFGYVYTQTKEVKDIKVHRIKNEADLTLQKFYFNNKKRVLKAIVTKEQFKSMEYKIGE